MGVRAKLKENRHAIRRVLAVTHPAKKLEVVKAFRDLGILNTPAALKLLVPEN